MHLSEIVAKHFVTLPFVSIVLGTLVLAPLASLPNTPIVAVIQMEADKTENKRIPISEARATMNELANTDNILSEKIERIQVNYEELNCLT